MSRAVNIFIKILISQYFNSSRCINYISNGNISISIENFQFVNYEIKHLQKTNLSENCDVYFIISDEPKCVVDIIEWKLKYENFSRYNNKRKYLIHCENSDCESVFTSRSLQYIENFLVFKSTHFISTYMNLIQEEDVVFELFTHKFSGLNKRHFPVLIDIWFSENETFRYNNNLYPNKITNQEEKFLTVSTFTYPPYSNPKDKIGSEISLILEYAKKFNFTLIVNDDFTWGTVTPEFEGSGVLGSVVKDLSDIGFSAIFAWNEKHHYFDYSYVFVETGVTCIVPSPSILIEWSSLFPNFAPKLKISILTTHGLVLILLIFIEINTHKKQRNTVGCYQTFKIAEYSLFIIIKTVFIQSLKKPMKTIILKIIILQLFLMSLIVSSLYSSGLSSSLTIPKFTGEINTAEELAQSNMRWIARQTDAWIESIFSAEKEDYIKLVKSFEEVSKENVVYKREQAYAIERLPSGYFAIDDELITQDVLQTHVAMKENLYKGKCVFVFRKNSVILPSFNQLLLQAQQGGFGVQWERNAVFKYSNSKIQTAVKYNFWKKAQQDQITVLHLRGVIIVWGIGLIISSVCLILEILYKHYYNNNRQFANK